MRVYFFSIEEKHIYNYALKKKKNDNLLFQ